MNVLIVDDVYIIRRLLKDMITKNYDYKIFEAESSAEAMRILDENIIDIVFLDIVMSKVDGLETVKKIRGLYSYYIIMCSSIANKKTVFDSINFGANDYITKPFDETRIKIAIEKALYNINEKKNK